MFLQYHSYYIYLSKALQGSLTVVLEMINKPLNKRTNVRLEPRPLYVGHFCQSEIIKKNGLRWVYVVKKL